MNLASHILPGDIVIKKAHNILGICLQIFLPKTVLNWPGKYLKNQSAVHTGIIGIHNGIKGVFESRLWHGYIFTRWEVYKKNIESGDIAVRIVRLINISKDQRNKINEFLQNKLKQNIKYDYVYMFKIMFNSLFPKHIKFKQPDVYIDNKQRWCCPEVVSYSYSHVKISITNDILFDTFQIEKGLKNKLFKEIGYYY